MKITSNVHRQIDLTDTEWVELRLELDRLFAEFTGEDGDRYPRLMALFEMLVDEKQ